MKKIIFLVLIFCLLFTVQAVEKVSRLGQHPFYKSRDLKPADLKVIALDKAGEVKQGFEQAGNGELVFAFLEQIQKADVQTIELNPGDTVQWMLFKKGRKVQVKNDVVWAGRKPITAYTFTIFRTGSYRLEPLEVAVGGTSLKTEPLQINVLSVLPQDDANPPLMDIVSPYRARARTMTVIFIAGAIAGAAALILFLMRFLRLKRRVKAESIQAENEVDPYLYSIRELEILKRESAANTADIKEAYSKLSFVLRFFIGKVLGLNALQMTTREIGRRLKRAQAPHAAELPAGIAAAEGAAAMPGDAPLRPWSWSPRASPRVMDLLKRSDMVKFAKEKPGPQNLGADIDEAQRIVEEVNRSKRGADGMEAAGTSMGGA